jgi:hypothetical protein
MKKKLMVILVLVFVFAFPIIGNAQEQLDVNEIEIIDVGEIAENGIVVEPNSNGMMSRVAVVRYVTITDYGRAYSSPNSVPATKYVSGFSDGVIHNFRGTLKKTAVVTGTISGTRVYFGRYSGNLQGGGNI